MLSQIIKKIDFNISYFYILGFILNINNYQLIMTSKYDYLLDKFKKVFHSIDYPNFNISYCNLSFIIRQKINLEYINNICKLQENFIEYIDFYKTERMHKKMQQLLVH
jgi:hypothetical protein